MKLVHFGPRPDWQERVETFGFDWHTINGDPYWDDTRAYQFSLAQIENHLETATEQLIEMCYSAVDRVSKDESLMTLMGIPVQYHEKIRRSWTDSDIDLYGRFDFAYDGERMPKMLEFNADTPTSLLEASVSQWDWLEARLNSGEILQGSDQFNSIDSTLLEAFTYLRQFSQDRLFHFASLSDNPEDKGTVRYLEDCAHRSGWLTEQIDIRDLGHDGRNFVDGVNTPIKKLFKLYPWEMMFTENYGPFVETGNRANTVWHEPMWKAILSNKAILPVLWEMFPKHPTLLESYFSNSDAGRAFLRENFVVEKPFFSREGANVKIWNFGELLQETDGVYNGPTIVQQFVNLAHDDAEIAETNYYPVIGSWYVAGKPAGISIREDSNPVTGNLSRFVPHFIKD